MSPELQKFYIDIQAWIDAGCPEHPEFGPWKALCFSLKLWAPRHGINDEHWWMINLEMVEQFRHRGLNADYPFNETVQSYIDEQLYDEMYKNANRLNWVREHAGARDES